jgi:uncharacterized protein YndB with AHSA1/START domain
MRSRVLVSLQVAATPERAFDVFVREIDKWWIANELFPFTRPSSGALAFEPELGGRFTETRPNGEVFEIGRITAFNPGAHLAFSWRQAAFEKDQATHVDVRFESIGAETRVTVEHFGWDAIPDDHAARHGFPDAIFLSRLGEWWQVLLAAMARRVRTKSAGSVARRP